MQSNWHDQEKHGIDIVLTLQEVQLRRKEKEKKKKEYPKRVIEDIFKFLHSEALYSTSITGQTLG